MKLVVRFFLLDFFFVLSATSSKEDLHRRIGGRCSTDNMKIIFKVCCEPESTTLKTTTSTTAVTWYQTVKFSGSTTTIPTTRKQVAQTETIQTKKPTKKKGAFFIKFPTKLIKCIVSFLDEYDKHPNEVIKNEELTSGGVLIIGAPLSLLLVIASIGCLRWR